MTFRTAFVALALSLPVAVAAQDIPPQVQMPPLSVTQLAALTLSISTSSNFSPGWDAITSVAIDENRLIRLFYRKSDGLFVGLMEDRNGIVLGQSRAWLIGSNAETFDVTPLVRTQPAWTTELIVFAYNRTTGTGRRFSLSWDGIPTPTAR